MQLFPIAKVLARLQGHLTPLFSRSRRAAPLRREIFAKLDLGRNSLDPFARKAQAVRGFYPG